MQKIWKYTDVKIEIENGKTYQPFVIISKANLDIVMNC